MIDNQRILLKFIQINTNINWNYISFYYKLPKFTRKFKLEFKYRFND